MYYIYGATSFCIDLSNLTFNSLSRLPTAQCIYVYVLDVFLSISFIAVSALNNASRSPVSLPSTEDTSLYIVVFHNTVKPHLVQVHLVQNAISASYHLPRKNLLNAKTSVSLSCH